MDGDTHSLIQHIPNAYTGAHVGSSTSERNCYVVQTHIGATHQNCRESGDTSKKSWSTLLGGSRGNISLPRLPLWKCLHSTIASLVHIALPHPFADWDYWIQDWHHAYRPLHLAWWLYKKGTLLPLIKPLISGNPEYRKPDARTAGSTFRRLKRRRRWWLLFLRAKVPFRCICTKIC